MAYNFYHAARLAGSNPKMESLPPEDFVPTWQTREEEEEVPVEVEQKGLLAKALAAFGIKR